MKNKNRQPFLILFMLGLFFYLPMTSFAVILPTSVEVTPMNNNATPPEPVGSGGGGRGGGAAINIPSNQDKSRVVLKGYSFPGASILIMKNAKSFADTKADSTGQFMIEINDLDPGITSFALVSKIAGLPDALPYSFTVTLVRGSIASVDNILLPPVVVINNSQFKKGQNIDFSGRAIPNSKVVIELTNLQKKEVVADKSGYWYYSIANNNFNFGNYNATAYSIDKNGGLSVKSSVVYFDVGRTTKTGAINRCANDVDISEDGKVDLVDFSILLYNFGKFVNKKTDLNCDNKIDYADFSILLYYWRG